MQRLETIPVRVNTLRPGDVVRDAGAYLEIVSLADAYRLRNKGPRTYVYQVRCVAHDVDGWTSEDAELRRMLEHADYRVYAREFDRLPVVVASMIGRM